jgi:tetratricopeptide (TPR) repeat protein
VAAAVFVTLAVIAALAVSLLEGKQAREQRDLAQRERLKTERINQFLQNTLGSAAPETSGTEVRLRQVMQEASKRAREQLVNEPEVMADVLLTLGRTYLSAGQFVAAEKDLRAALEISSRSNGELSETTAASLAWLGLTLAYQHKTDEGERISRKAVELERKLHPGGHESLGVALYSLGVHLTARNDLKDAESTLTQASEAIEHSLEVSHGYYLATLGALGTVYEKGRDFDKAQQLYQRAIDLSEYVEPRYRIFRAQVESYFGRLLVENGKYEEAEPLLRESETFYIEESNEPSPSVGQIKQLLGMIALSRSDHASAEEQLKESLDILQRQLPPEHPAVARTGALLGLTLTRQNRAAEGEIYLRKALEVQKKSGNDRTTFDDTTGALGECLMRQQRYDQAEPLLLESYNDFKASLGEKHPRTIEARSRLISFYQATGRKAKDLTGSSGNVEP